MNNVAILSQSITREVVTFGKKERGIGRFLNIKDITTDTIDAVKKNLLSIGDEAKIELTSVLIDRWMHYEVDKDSVYVKHIASGRMNVLYQVVLGGQDWDGIYEFSLKGKAVKIKGFVVNDKNTLVIESNGNYDVAMFGEGEKESYSITRMDFATDEEFGQALVNSGLLSEEDLEIYYKPEEIVKPYLNKVLPSIILK